MLGHEYVLPQALREVRGGFLVAIAGSSTSDDEQRAQLKNFARRLNFMPRRDLAISLLLFVAAMLFFGWVSVRPEFNGLLSDSYVYLAAAEAMAPGAGSNPALVRHILGAYPFPPLYPLILGLLGGGSAAPVLTYCIGAATLALVCLLFRCWLRGLGVPQFAALLACVALALLPLTLQMSMGVLSEPLYMGFVLGAAMLMSTRRPTARHWQWAAAFVAMATLTRSVGVTALAAFGLCWLLARAWRIAPLAPVIALLPPAAWTLVKQLAGYHDYTLEVVTARDLLGPVAVNVQAWRQFAVQAVDLATNNYSASVLALIGVVVGAVLIVRLLRGAFDAWYCAIYLAVMMLWPYPHHVARFLFVLTPFVIGYGVLGTQMLASRLRVLAGVLPATVPTLLLVLALPSSAILTGNLWRQHSAVLATAMRSPGWYQVDAARAASAMAFARRLASFQARYLPRVPANACVASVIPQQVLVYGPRAGIDLAKSRANGLTLTQALADCPYVLMVAAQPYPPVKGIGSLYPFDAIHKRMEVLAFERDRPSDPGSPLIAMLAKVH